MEFNLTPLSPPPLPPLDPDPWIRIKTNAYPQNWFQYSTHLNLAEINWLDSYYGGGEDTASGGHLISRCGEWLSAKHPVDVEAHSAQVFLVEHTL